MESDGIHELTAAYALNALDPDEERDYEEHLRHCPSCRDELADLQEAATSLAYATESPAPPVALRERIVEAALAERSNVVPLRRRFTTPALGAVAAAAAGIAIGLGIWASSLSSSLSDERALAAQYSHVIGLFTSNVQQVPLKGANGSLVVDRNGDSAIVLAGLQAAPAGKTYEAWVIKDGKPLPAGTFRGGGPTSVHRLTRPVPKGAIVAVTVEPEGGVDAPTTQPFAASSTV
jgi:anti-sigma-K factor RskA